METRKRLIKEETGYSLEGVTALTHTKSIIIKRRYKTINYMHVCAYWNNLCLNLMLLVCEANLMKDAFIPGTSCSKGR